MPSSFVPLHEKRLGFGDLQLLVLINQQGTDRSHHGQIWAHGKSTVGTGAESKVYARNVQIRINDVSISPGDMVLCDPLEGVVVIPNQLVDEVIDLIPKLAAADDNVKKDVERGSTVAAAFQRHRS